MILKTGFKLTALIPLLFAVITGSSCKKEGTTTQNTNDSSLIPSGAIFSFLALGDSYTIGQNVTPEERFAAQTGNLLKQKNLKIGTPTYIATTGWTTVNLMNAINTQNPAPVYDIVTLLIGVNDQYQHLDTAAYRTRFTELLNKSIQLARNRTQRVFVLSIPDYSVTPFVGPGDKARVSMEIDQFNAINKQVTQSKNVVYVDITPSTRQAATDPTLISSDNLHPSGKEYKKWAEMLAPLIETALK